MSGSNDGSEQPSVLVKMNFRAIRVIMFHVYGSKLLNGNKSKFCLLFNPLKQKFYVHSLTFNVELLMFCTEIWAFKG